MEHIIGYAEYENRMYAVLKVPKELAARRDMHGHSIIAPLRSMKHLAVNAPTFRADRLEGTGQRTIIADEKITLTSWDRNQ